MHASSCMKCHAGSMHTVHAWSAMQEESTAFTTFMTHDRTMYGPAVCMAPLTTEYLIWPYVYVSCSCLPHVGWLSPSQYNEVPGQLQLAMSSFPGAGHMARPGSHAVPGTLINTNTLEAFKAADKPKLLQQVCGQPAGCWGSAQGQARIEWVAAL